MRFDVEVGTHVLVLFRLETKIYVLVAERCSLSTKVYHTFLVDSSKDELFLNVSFIKNVLEMVMMKKGMYLDLYMPVIYRSILRKRPFALPKYYFFKSQIKMKPIILRKK